MWVRNPDLYGIVAGRRPNVCDGFWLVGRGGRPFSAMVSLDGQKWELWFEDVRTAPEYQQIAGESVEGCLITNAVHPEQVAEFLRARSSG